MQQKQRDSGMSIKHENENAGVVSCRPIISRCTEQKHRVSHLAACFSVSVCLLFVALKCLFVSAHWLGLLLALCWELKTVAGWQIHFPKALGKIKWVFLSVIPQKFAAQKYEKSSVQYLVPGSALSPLEPLPPLRQRKLVKECCWSLLHRWPSSHSFRSCPLPAPNNSMVLDEGCPSCKIYSLDRVL